MTTKNHNLFPYIRVMGASKLIPQVKLTQFNPRNKKELREYHKDYRTKIGLEGRWYVSEKIVGVRAIWDGKNLVTKNFKEIKNVPKWFLNILPRHAPLEGVLTNFNMLNPSVDPEWSKVKYIVYDMPTTKYVFHDRLTRLRNIPLFKLQEQHLKRIPKDSNSSHDDRSRNSSNRKQRAFKLKNLHLNNICLQTFTEIQNIQNDFRVVNSMYSDALIGDKGLMLINASNMYRPGESKSFYEYKEDHAGEATIIGYKEGENKYYGILGKYQCKIPENGKKFYLGVGIPDEIRKQYEFFQTKLTNINVDNEEIDVPLIGDTVIYHSEKMIKDNTVPRLPIYVGHICNQENKNKKTTVEPNEEEPKMSRRTMLRRRKENSGRVPRNVRGTEEGFAPVPGGD